MMHTEALKRKTLNPHATLRAAKAYQGLDTLEALQTLNRRSLNPALNSRFSAKLHISPASSCREGESMEGMYES